MSVKSSFMAAVALSAVMLWSPVLRAEVTSIDDPAADKFFAEATAKAGFWGLMHYYESQVDQTYCGVASASIILNSLNVDAPPSPAIYPYRKFDQSNFFSEAVLAIKSPKLVHLGGLTLEELAAMIRVQTQSDPVRDYGSKSEG